MLCIVPVMPSHPGFSLLAALAAVALCGCGSNENSTASQSAAGTAGTADQSSGGDSHGGTAGSSGGGSAGSSSGGASMAGASQGGSSAGPACPGVQPLPDQPGTTCRSTDDCAPQYSCSAQPLGLVCGACLPSVHECDSDEGCSAEMKCVPAEFDPCLCAGDPGTRCIARCTADSCADGERCSDGACEPVPCTEGYDCDELRVCAPERAGSDAHGCALRNCNEGYVCETGYACDAESGNCNAIHCREGGDAACRINQVCDDTSAGRGCQPKPCEIDSDCDCGACIHTCTGQGCGPGQCHDRLWLCNPPAPG
jgi:hypothetical protein